ncbi:MAG TPA: hypothetical protein VGG75_06250 [Trebonia sp.]
MKGQHSMLKYFINGIREARAEGKRKAEEDWQRMERWLRSLSATQLDEGTKRLIADMKGES